MNRSVALLLIALVAAGCGTVESDLEFEFDSEGRGAIKMAARATGALASRVAEAPGPFSAFDREVWVVERSEQDKLLTYTATTRGRLTPDEMAQAFPTTGAAGSEWVGARTHWLSADALFWRVHKAVIDIPASKPPAFVTEPAALVDPRVFGEHVDKAFKFDVGITMPGTITGGNADSVSGSRAAWSLTYARYLEGRRLEVESREPVWPAIGVAGALVLAGLAGGGWSLFRARVSA